MSILLEARERGAWAIPGLDKIVLLNWDDQSKFDKFNSLTVTHVKITDNHIVSEPEIEYNLPSWCKKNLYHCRIKPHPYWKADATGNSRGHGEGPDGVWSDL